MLDLEMIYNFLLKVDNDFPIPLSDKCNLEEFSKKIYEKATICKVVDNNEIKSMLVGYTNNLIDERAYISILVTLPSAYGKGYANMLLKEFIDICKEKKIHLIHLYTHRTNHNAIKLYKKFGFIECGIYNEERENDIHLIYKM